MILGYNSSRRKGDRSSDREPLRSGVRDMGQSFVATALGASLVVLGFASMATPARADHLPGLGCEDHGYPVGEACVGDVHACYGLSEWYGTCAGARYDFEDGELFPFESHGDGDWILITPGSDPLEIGWASKYCFDGEHCAKSADAATIGVGNKSILRLDMKGDSGYYEWSCKAPEDFGGKLTFRIINLRQDREIKNNTWTDPSCGWTTYFGGYDWGPGVLPIRVEWVYEPGASSAPDEAVWLDSIGLPGLTERPLTIS